MFKPRWTVAFLIIVLVGMTCGCLRSSFTDKKIAETIQLFLDSGPDPSDEHALTVEERAVIESFVIYRNTLKIKLVDGTEQPFWTPVGLKTTRVFAYACRDADFLNNAYYGDLYLNVEIDDDIKKVLVGRFTFNNSSERIETELFSAN
jgi:hypothetical protein